MNSQETIYKMLAVKGDIHERISDNVSQPTCSCGSTFLFLNNLNSHIERVNNPDLTTETGAFWLMSRLEGWDRCEEFTYWLYANILGGDLPAPNLSVAAMDAMWWLTIDAKDGKAPALFNALCEFTGVEVEE